MEKEFVRILMKNQQQVTFSPQSGARLLNNSFESAGVGHLQAPATTHHIVENDAGLDRLITLSQHVRTDREGRDKDSAGQLWLSLQEVSEVPDQLGLLSESVERHFFISDLFYFYEGVKLLYISYICFSLCFWICILSLVGTSLIFIVCRQQCCFEGVSQCSNVGLPSCCDLVDLFSFSNHHRLGHTEVVSGPHVVHKLLFE